VDLSIVQATSNENEIVNLGKAIRRILSYSESAKSVRFATLAAKLEKLSGLVAGMRTYRLCLRCGVGRTIPIDCFSE